MQIIVSEKNAKGVVYTATDDVIATGTLWPDAPDNWYAEYQAYLKKGREIQKQLKDIRHPSKR